MKAAEYSSIDPSDDQLAEETPVLTDIRDRLRWIRIFELDVSRKKMAELLGPGYDDSTIGTWEKKLHMPHDTGAIARRYREVAKSYGREISAEWILYGYGRLVTLVTYLDIVEEPQLVFPNFDYPPAKRQGSLQLMEGGRNGADRAAS